MCRLQLPEFAVHLEHIIEQASFSQTPRMHQTASRSRSREPLARGTVAV